jgi:hypothetical protein
MILVRKPQLKMSDREWEVEFNIKFSLSGAPSRCEFLQLNTIDSIYFYKNNFKQLLQPILTDSGIKNIAKYMI